MENWKTTAITAAALVVAAVVMSQVSDVPLYITLPVFAVVGAVLIIATIIEYRDNKKSFDEAARFRAGYAFKNQREENKYYAWAEKHPPQHPSQNMLRDLINRYRAPRLVAELLGVLALGLVEIVLFKERAEGRGEEGVIYIVLGLMILLLYFALSNIFGFKARRFYNRLTDMPEFLNIERSYQEGLMVGSSPSFLNIGSEYIILLTPKAVIPVKRSEIQRVCRATVLTAYYTNSIYSGTKETHFIKVYSSVQQRVQLKKFSMILAYELLKSTGLPADDTIDMR